MGLYPAITVNGSTRAVDQSDAFPWIAFLETASGRLDVRWRGLHEAIELKGEK